MSQQVDSDERPFTFREKAIMEATADATAKRTMDMLKADYPKDQYGTQALKNTLDDYFFGITPETHLDHHKWIGNASAGRTTQEISWPDFWYSLAKGAAAIVLGFIGLAVLWSLIQYLKAGAPAIPGVTH